MALKEIGQFIGAKIAGVLITVAVVAAGIWAWQHPEELRSFGRVLKLTLLWLLIAAALPWGSYLFMRPVLDWQSRMVNAKAASAISVVVIALFCLADVFLAFMLADWSIHGGWTWCVVLLGFLAAGAYNFVICESLARHVDG